MRDAPSQFVFCIPRRFVSMPPARRYSRAKRSCRGKRGGQKSKVVQVELFRSHLLQTFCSIVLTVCTMNNENRFPCLASCLVARCLTNPVWKEYPQKVLHGYSRLANILVTSSRPFSNDAFRLYDPPFSVRKPIFTNRHFSFTIHPSPPGNFFAAVHISTLRSCLR